MKFRLEPLAALAGMSMPELSRALGISGTQWKDSRDNGVGERAADRYAVRLGFHPSVVWPEWTELSMEKASSRCPECGQPFIPVRRSHRFCTRACYHRRYKREKARTRYATDPEFRASQIAKSRTYHRENRRAVLVKKRAYYQANRDAWPQGRARRKAAA